MIKMENDYTTIFEEKKRSLQKRAKNYKEAIVDDAKEIKNKAGSVVKSSLIFGGISLLLYKTLTSSKQTNKKSTIANIIKSQIVLYLLVFARKKIIEYIDKLDKEDG